MKISFKYVLSFAAASMLAGCFTTRYELGPQPSGKIEEDTFPSEYTERNTGTVSINGVEQIPVETTRHCGGGKIATITTEKGFTRQNIKLDCAAALASEAPAAKAGGSDDSKKSDAKKAPAAKKPKKT